MTVQIVDASIVDSLAPILAQARFEYAAEGQWEIPFVMNAPDLEHAAGHDIRVIARVMAEAGDVVSANDYLTTESVRFESGLAREDVLLVPVSKVGDQD